jgi:hypothetical protein
MTKPATATKAQVKRNIQAALASGLRVRGIRPDGTVMTDDTEDATTPPNVKSKWADDSPDDESVSVPIGRQG